MGWGRVMGEHFLRMCEDPFPPTTTTTTGRKLTPHSVRRYLQPPWRSLGLASLFMVGKFFMYMSYFQASGS